MTFKIISFQQYVQKRCEALVIGMFNNGTCCIYKTETLILVHYIFFFTDMLSALKLLCRYIPHKTNCSNLAIIIKKKWKRIAQ